MKKGCLVAAALLGLIVCGVIGLVVFRARTTPSYPTTPEGWSARWEAAAAEFGRTPGENWDLWLEVRSEIESAMSGPGGADPERVGAALDRLKGLRFTKSIPDTIGTEAAIDDFFPLVTSARNLFSSVVGPNFRDALARGDLDATLAWWERGLALSRVTEAQGLVIGTLVFDACWLVLLDALRGYLITPGGIDTAWAGDRLESIGVTDDLGWYIETEREFGLGVIAEQRRAMGARGLLVAADEGRLYERIMDLWRDSHRGGDPTANAELHALHTRIDSDTLFARRRPNLSVVIPTTDGPVRVRRSVLAQIDGLRLLLALRRFHERTGAYPTSLAELVPSELTGLPEDPLAPDGQYRYRLLDAGTQDPVSAFLLYSVGSDGVDDGGRWPAPNTGNPLANRNTSGDHVFNRPWPSVPESGNPDEDADAEDAEQP